jgi:beta-phosphoglucomutase
MRSHLFDIDPWIILEEQFSPETFPAKETLFTLANGYLGVRGCHEEGAASWWRGTYINGFYESRPIIYGERAYGYADRYQTILNCSDASEIELRFEGKSFIPDKKSISNYRRSLDLRSGILFRTLNWKPEGEGGPLLRIESERLCPYKEKHLLLIRYRVRMEQGSGSLSLRALLNGDVTNLSAGEDPRTGSHILPGDFGTSSVETGKGLLLMNHFTTLSGLRLASAMKNSFTSTGNKEVEVSLLSGEAWASSTGSLFLQEGEQLEMVSIAGWFDGIAGEEEKLAEGVDEAVHGAALKGFDAIAGDQRAFLDAFWEDGDIKVEDDPEVQQSIRFNLFHLLQGAGRGGTASLPAKGLTGEGYEGHYFWDTEIYALPFFTYTRPDIARDLLLYRYEKLPQARGRAAQLARQGALFPWRTINGNEASAFFPAGTAQYHINADIAYAVARYLDATGDRDFLPRGCEILIETARFWLDLGDYIPSLDNAFCFNCVTGPDEYTALVNNNYYTNIMARENFRYAIRFLKQLEESDPEQWKTFVKKTGFEEAEAKRWSDAAEALYLPYHEALGVHPQDDSFLKKERWEADTIPPEKRPLLLHYHPLTIYRYQILKQADLVLAQMLLGHYFSRAEKKRDFDYYDPLTTADSSLSPCIQGVMAAELGYRETAYRHFIKSIRMDLDDVNGNVKDGVHTAAMAGSWISMVYGFAGFRDRDGEFHFSPALPDPWKSLSFTLRKGDGALKVTIGREEAAFQLKRGREITIYLEGKAHRVSSGAPLVISLRPELEGLIFDLDGVITDSAEYHYLAWKQLCDELDIPFDREFNHNLKGVSRMASLDLLLGRKGIVLDEKEKITLASRKNEYYKELIKQITPEDLLPGIGDLLQKLRSSGVKLALASASKNAGAILEYLHLADKFDVITDPAALRKGKPDPEQFFMAAELLGIPYRNCIGVEDAQAGVNAINDAGMISVGIGSYLKGADLILESTAELNLELLREHFYRNA